MAAGPGCPGPARLITHRPYPGASGSSDGFPTLSIGSSASFLGQCKVISAPEFASVLCLSGPARREQHRAAVNATIDTVTNSKTTCEWVKILNAAGVPAGLNYQMDEVFTD